MKISKNIFICALLVLMLLVCVNAASAEEPLNETLGADVVDDLAIDETPDETLSASGDTYVVDANGGGQYTSISSAVSAATGGETIFVKNGEYSESNTITFTKSVNIVGESQDGVKITGAAKSLFSTVEPALTLSFTNLTILNAGSGSNPALKLTYSAHDLTLTNCTFDNCGSKFGTMQLGHPGTTTIDNCKILNSKETTSAGAGAIYLSGAGETTIKNTVIDNVQYTVSSSYMNGVIYVYSDKAVLNIENTTISNVTAPTRGVINTVGTVNIKGSKIQGNTLNQYSDTMTSHVVYVGDKGKVNIEQTEISDNTCGSTLFNNYKATSSIAVNYCNIHDNSASGTVNSVGTVDLEANWWGSSDKPADVSASTWVVENNDEYTLNTGDALAKDIPGLTGEGGDEPVSGNIIYVSPSGDDSNDGTTKDTAVAGLSKAVELVPEGGTIYLLDGTYKIEMNDYWGSNVLFINKAISFIGESVENTIIDFEENAYILTDLEDEDGNPVSYDFLTFENINFKDGGSEAILSIFADVGELNVTNCIMDGCYGMGLFALEGVENLNIADSILVSEAFSIIDITGDTPLELDIHNNILIGSTCQILDENGIATGKLYENYHIGYTDISNIQSLIESVVIANATVVPAGDIKVNDAATIKVDFNSYNKSGEITESSKLIPNVAIGFAADEGTLSAETADMKNGIATVTYTSDVERTDVVHISMYGKEIATVDLNVIKPYVGIIYVNTTGNNDNEGSIDAPVATIDKAIELALADGGSGQIIIDEGTYTGNGYHITGDLTVTGVGKVTIDANNEGRLFYMNYGDAASKIELSNLILTNANGYGAAVYSFANELVLDNVTIVNNQASGYLISSRGKLTITDSNISNSMSGDVIQQSGSGDIIINNTVFENNSVVDSTSVMAVVNINSGSGNLVIEDSRFVNNTARQGIIKGNFNYNIEIKGCEFIDNTNTASYGGAIYASATTLDVVDSVFVNNKAARSGGAIYVGYRTTATVDKCIFVNNTANTMADDYTGDAIYNGNKLTVNNSILLTNAENFIIFNDGEDNVVNAQNNWWGTNDNPKSLNGVGTYEDDDWEEYDCAEVDVSNWVTMDASFTPADAIAGDDVTVTATFSNTNLPDGINVTFTSTSGKLNTVVAAVGGQASTTYTIDANDENITATSTNAVIDMPITKPYEGIIYVNATGNDNNDGSSSAPVATVAKAVELAQGKSGQIIIDEGAYDIEATIEITDDLNITTVGDVVLAGPGSTSVKAFYIKSGDVSISNLTFINFNASYTGSVIRVAAGSLTLDGTNFVKNGGENREAIVYVRNADLTLTNSIFRDNTAHKTSTSYGIVSVGTGTLYMDNCNFTNNYNKYGCLYLSSVIATIYNSSFVGNNASSASGGTGAGIYVGGTATYISSYSGKQMNGSASYVLVQGCDFINNTAFGASLYAGQGGAVYVNNNATVFIDDCLFENNSVTNTTGNDKAGQGGAIYASAGKIIISKSIFKNNDAAEGSEIYMRYYNSHLHPEEVNYLDITDSIILNDGENVVMADSDNGTYTANNNWWGTNDEPASKVNDNVVVESWATMDASFTPEFAQPGDEVTVTATFSNANLPDGINVTFTSTSGNLNTVVATVGGQASTTYTIDANDKEIVATSSDAVIVMPIITNVVTNDTFFRYFDEDGMLLDTIPFDELIFQGDFSDLVDVIIITDEITLTSDNAVLNNIALSILGDDVVVNGFTFNADADFTTNGGAVVYVSGMDVTLDNISVTYTAPSEVEAKAVFANGADGFNLINSEIIFTGVNPGDKHNRGLEVRNTDDAVINNNTINAILPAVSVSWGGSGIDQDLVLAVGIQGGDGVEFTNNRVNVNTKGSVGSYPTVDAVMIHSAADILIKGNNITHVDTTTDDSSRYYYSLDIYSTNATVEENNIIVNTTAGVDRAGTAYPIQVTGPAVITIKNNNLTAVSKGPVAGIYASNWAGAATLIVEDNNIDVTGYATTGNYALVAGIEAEIDLLKAYNNTIVVTNGAEFNESNQAYGISMTSSYVSGVPAAEIMDNNITVNGNYAVYYVKASNTNITDNDLYAYYLVGDDAAVIVEGDNDTIENNRPYQANITVSGDNVWTGSDATVTVSVPNATGTVTIEVNGKSYDVELDENGTATKDIPAEDLVAGENIVSATYKGTAFAPTTNITSVFVLDGVVTQDTYELYFNQDDNGRLFDYVPEGATLDFQGRIINPDQAKTVQMNVNKPVNIVSTTEDAYVDLNTTAGSLLGESPGNSFAVTNGGSGSNVTGIYFHNTQLWISNTHDVVLDNLSVVVEDQRVGSGVGATTIRDNSSNVVLKNSYLYTRNNGGSTTFTMSWATNCTIDNCTVKAEGNVGNLVYLNTFNIAGAPTGVPLNNYNKVINNRIYGKEGAGISIGLMIEGQYNWIENNTLYKSSISNSFGGQNPFNNTYVGNTLTEGGSLTAQAGSIVYNNNVTGTLSTGKQSTVYNNTVGKSMTVGESAVAYDNTVATTVSVSGKNAVVENNTITGAVTIAKAATNTTFVGNNVSATITVNSNNNVIKENNIITTGNYAVDLKSTTGNNVTDNLLIASALKGDAAVSSASETNIVENNRPVPANLVVVADNITVGETAVINVTVDSDAEGTVSLIVNGKVYTVEITDGNGQVTVDDLTPSDYTVTVSFVSSDIEYLDSENSTVFNVAKLETEIAIDVINATLGEDATVVVTVPNATGSVKIIINGEEHAVDLEDGQATYTIEDIAAGDYNVVAFYAGDKNHDAASNSTTFTVEKVVPEIIVDVPAVDYGSDAVITIEIANATGNVFVDVGSNKYYAELENGVATVTVPNVVENATVTVKYDGDDQYDANSTTAELIVNKIATTLSGSDLEMGYKDGSAWTVTLTDANGDAIADATVGIGIKGKVYNIKTDANGVASLAINLAPGTYDINATFDETEKYASSFVNATITVGTGASVLSADNLVMNYKDGSAWTVTLTDANGNAISGVNIAVGIKGATYSVKTDADGVAKLPVNLAPGTYDINATFGGNKYYSEAFVNATVTVEKAVATLTASDLEMSYKDGSTYDVNVVDANGAAVANAVVKFTIGTSNYNIKTDANGVAKLPVNVYIGEYDVTATLNDANYESEAVSNTITVKDYDAEIVASDVNMTYKDGTAYEVQLTDGEGNNIAVANLVVKITIKGSTYNVKTDANGIAKLTINLSAGTYDISAEYNGKVINNTITVNKA